MSNTNSSPSPELLRLISGLTDGQLSESDHRRLGELLRDDEEAQEEYRRIMSVHALLKFDLVQASPMTLPSRAFDGAADLSNSASKAIPSHRFSKPLGTRRRNALIAGVGLAICLLVVFAQRQSRNEEHELVASAARGESTGEVGMPPLCLVVFRQDATSASSTDHPQSLDEVKSGLSVNQMADIVTYMKEHSVRAKSFAGNHPEEVRQQENGSVTLNAKTAQIYGTTLVFEEHFENLGFWASSDDWAVWRFSTKTAVNFDVVIDYSCLDIYANNRFVLAIDDQQISGTAAGTGTWENYQQVVVGQIRLEPGDHRLVFRATDELKGCLVDLRSVILRPARIRLPSEQSVQ